MSSSCQQAVGGPPPFISGARAAGEQEAEAGSRLLSQLCRGDRLAGPHGAAGLLFPRADGSGRARGMSSISGIAKQKVPLSGILIHFSHSPLQAHSLCFPQSLENNQAGRGPG